MKKLSLLFFLILSVSAWTLFKSDIGTLKDPRDGNVYKTVKIGNQIWMAENLRHEPELGSFVSYENDKANGEKFGYLYEWDDAAFICPDQWRLPEEKDLKELVKTLGGAHNAGKKMKSKTGWANSGNNKSGFSALAGGLNKFEEFIGMGEESGWWLADFYYEGYPCGLSYALYSDTDSIFTYCDHIDGALMYVRCIKD
ncbi:MAG: hypothetical protein JJU02_03830 [Cryomorphaceae bacterium]|nr:hypothetical protein [Cryomorphaceae bacterium]